MVRVAVVGAGVSGLAACVALARDGHHVTLFERDPLEVAADAHEAFEADRRGAPQIRHSHAFLARLRNLLRDHYPDVLEALHAAGATDLRFADGLPATITEYVPEPGDEDLSMLACRRTTFEWVLRRVATAEGGVEVRGGVEVVGLVTDSAAVTAEAPVVVRGVRLASGTEEPFDLTVVATGRRSALPVWLSEIGAGEVPEVSDESGIVYFSRFYRLQPGRDLPPRTGPIGGDLGYLKYGVFAGDNGTFSLTLAAATDDRVMRRLLDDDEVFDRAGQAMTFTAPYLDGRAEPITGVHKIAGLMSRWRDYAVDGRALAIGVVPIGDALLATNPLYGRGCTTGFWAAHLLSEKLRTHSDDLTAGLMAYYVAVECDLHPWVVATMRTDADARRVSAAILAGADPDGPPDDPDRGKRSVLRDGLRPALRSDIAVLRAFMRNFNLLTAPDALAMDGDFLQRVFAAWGERDARPPEPVLGPSRDVMLSLLGAGAPTD